MQVQSPPHSHEPIGLLWLGDATDAVAHFAGRAPHVQIAHGDIASLVAELQSGLADLLVLDATQNGIDVSAVLGHLQAATLDTPVLLLTAPGGEDLAIQAGRFAVCDCVVKTADYLLQLLPAIGQLRARHDLVVLFRTNRQSQDRLRTILEFQPAVTSVINTDGIITAMNQAGLTLLGAARDQIVGRPFTSLVPDESRYDASAFVHRVCQGEAADFDHLVIREGGFPLAVRTRAVPFRNGDTVVALATLQERIATPPATNPELEALSAAALADALGEIESLRGQRDLWAAQRDTYETRVREAAAHADAVLQQAQADAATLARERAEWALERQQQAQRQREADQIAAEFEPLRAELDDLRAQRGQWLMEQAAWVQERDHAAWQHQQALDAERLRADALLADLQEARARDDERASLQRALDADHAAVLKLRDDLQRFMADADSQCRTIIEQHEAPLAPNAVVTDRSFT